MSAVFSALLGAGLSSLVSRDAVNDQNRFNEQMYLRYKTPMAQARQLRQAGLNPAFALSNIAQGAIQTPEQSAPADTSGMQSLSSSLPTAFLQDAQSSLASEPVSTQGLRYSCVLFCIAWVITRMSASM